MLREEIYRFSSPPNQWLFPRVPPLQEERIAIVTPGQGVLQGRIHDRVFRGSYYAYEVVVPGRPEPIFAYQQADQDRAGEAARDGAVGIAWRAENAVLLLDEAA